MSYEYDHSAASRAGQLLDHWDIIEGRTHHTTPIPATHHTTDIRTHFSIRHPVHEFSYTLANQLADWLTGTLAHYRAHYLAHYLVSMARVCCLLSCVVCCFICSKFPGLTNSLAN